MASDAAPASPIVLASASASRAHLLRSAGISFDIDAAAIDEEALQRTLEGKEPRAIAQALAEAKAMHVSKRRPGRWVIGGDQILFCEGRLYNKPKSRADARTSLQRLAGRSHSLHAGVAIARDGVIQWSHVAEARLAMRPLSEAFLDWYLDAIGEIATTTVGAYAVEGLGIHLFDSIEGEHSTILGLPLLPLLAFLRARSIVRA